ncbi:MAG: leucyl aminopeptidase [Candidatus Brocadiaceae bacterium]|nr:leucyl aminopeptidase [Candidatus Brocadiaceae bacterium]
MNINTKVGTAEKERTDLLVFYLFEDVKTIQGAPSFYDALLNQAISELLKRKAFQGKLNTTCTLHTYGRTPANRIMLVGLGKKKDFTPEKIRQAAGTTTKTIRGMGENKATIVMDFLTTSTATAREWSQAYVEGSLLSLYTFQKYKQVQPEEKKTVTALTLLLTKKEDLAPVHEAIIQGQIIAEAVSFTRDLINTPAQDKTPSMLAKSAKKLSQSLGIHCKVLSLPDLKKLGMGGLLGVAQGSMQPPKFIIMEYNTRAKNQNTIVLIGKGITFDSGGISLKPAKNMDQMKSDMAGAAAVLGAIQAVSKLKIPQHIIGLIPCTENMPSGTAIKPGDIITILSGKTVEVLNTDAEGRLILADALAYAEQYKPHAVIDLATLTGACVVALGDVVTGMMGNNEELKKRVKTAGDNSWERVWELPLWDEYQEQIKSDIADMKNIGGPYAGAITAACFLSKFTEKYPWAHLDIAGTSWCDKESAYMQKGASGIGVRLLVQLMQNWTPMP